MSLYHEAASILTGPTDSGGSLKSRIYNNKTLKSSAAHLYALVSETLKWSDVLREVVERSQLLGMEKKLTPILAVLLVHDLLLRNGIAATASHPLKLAVTRHKARLNAEFVRARLRRGFSSIDAIKASVNLHGGTETKVLGNKGGKGSARCYPHPRWVRINTLRTTLETQLETTFAEYSPVCSLTSILEAPSSKKVLHIDCHIPDLLALPPGADLTSSAAYMRGDIIFQDKASCFPAYLLDPSPEDGEIIDACAAPGNKTTHLAALLSARCRAGGEPLKSTSIWGFERDKTRAETLKKLVETAGANRMVTVIAGQDSLRADPDSGVWRKAAALLLDPSCSGSGIIGRDEMPHLALPSRDTKVQVKARNNKKRKRSSLQGSSTSEGTTDRVSQHREELSSDALSQRLSSLSAFQLKLLLHSFRFPSVRKVVYSTCSIHAEENEHVVVRALNSDVAKHMGWRVLRREEQVAGLREWSIRGSLNACKGLEGGSGVTEVVAEACLRCSKGSKEGTMGFFVVGFVRDLAVEEEDSIAPGHRDAANWDGEDEEWEGFSDGSSTSNVVPAAVGLDRSDRTPVGKKEKKEKRKKCMYSPARA